MATAFDSIQNLGQDNVQAAVKTFGAFTKGVQLVASELADYNKAAIERGTAFFQDLAQAKDVSEAIQIQTNYLKSSYDNFAVEIGKLNGIWKEITVEATKTPGRGTPKAKVQ